jgi:hypothetical protein
MGSSHFGVRFLGSKRRQGDAGRSGKVSAMLVRGTFTIGNVRTTHTFTICTLPFDFLVRPLRVTLRMDESTGDGL